MANMLEWPIRRHYEWEGMGWPRPPRGAAVTHTATTDAGASSNTQVEKASSGKKSGRRVSKS